MTTDRDASRFYDDVFVAPRGPDHDVCVVAPARQRCRHGDAAGFADEAADGATDESFLAPTSLYIGTLASDERDLWHRAGSADVPDQAGLVSDKLTSEIALLRLQIRRVLATADPKDTGAGQERTSRQIALLASTLARLLRIETQLGKRGDTGDVLADAGPDALATDASDA